MTRSRRRLVSLLLAVPVFLRVTASLYSVGMATLEGKHRGFWDSLEWAGETLSTTGYGSDSHWSHPVMVLFVVFVQWMGMLFVFLVFQIYLIPALEDRFE